MLRTLAARHARRRRGAVLIVVLAMLVLFAVLGLSFVLYSEAQLSAAQGQKESINTDSPPNALAAAEAYVGPLIFDVSNVGDDLMNPVRAHSLGRSKYGVVYDSNPASATYGQFVTTYVPYNAANAIPQEAVTIGGTPFTDSRQIVRYTWDTTSNSVFDPELFYNFASATPGSLRTSPNVNVSTANGTYVGKNYPFTYPDRHDFYLAQMDATTGRITVPSFHRPELGSWDPNDPNPTNYFENQGAAGKFRTLRPRRVENPNFPPVPMDPDGQYRGDVSNMKFISATTPGGPTAQQNDSYWMYAGGPVLRWRGKNYTACVAPLILDLNNRVNLSVAGNLRSTNAANPAFPHGSKEGWGPWEVNPLQLGLTAADLTALVTRRQGNTTIPPADPYTQQAYSTRINGGKMPWQGALVNADGNGPAANDSPLSLPLTPSFQTTPIFNSPLVAATPFRFSPYQNDLLNLNLPAGPATGALANHPAQFNPLVYNRPPSLTAVAPATGAGSFGHDDGVKMSARYSDPKNRQATVTGVPAGTSLDANNQLRALTTHFSTSQQWAGVTVYGRPSTGGNLAAVRLGPIDLNRPLPDYRKNPAFAHSPLNMWNPADTTSNFGGYTPAQLYAAALTARQRLARDIFIRLAARYGLIDGNTAVYYTDTGNVEVFVPEPPAADPSGNRDVLMRLAQMAVNLVDYIDGDDIVTPFVWRPTPTSAKLADPALDITPAGNNFLDANNGSSRVVYGTEAPRLVINEVYGGVFNDRTEDPAAPMNKATKPLKRRYWIELYNPTPGTNTSSPGNAPANYLDPVRSDNGAARLRYDPLNTQLTDPLDPTGATTKPAPFDYNPYRIEVAVAPSTATVAPYAYALQTAISTGGYGAAVSDTNALLASLPNPNTTTLMARVNTYVPAVANGNLPGDTVNLIYPDRGTSTLPGGTNLGYYLIGPEDQFPTSPAGGVVNSLSLRDPRDPATGNPVAGVPPNNAPLNGPVDALTFDVTTGGPTDTDITNETNKTSTVILRRLLNPYLPPQENQALANYNPYITVDFLEKLPTRDRAVHNSAGTPATRTVSNAASVGRIHPLLAFPDYGVTTLNGNPVTPAVQDQLPPGGGPPPTTPPHTFFGINNPADNKRGTPLTYGFEWLVHLDRELVSFPEAAAASRTSPALLTHAFFNAAAGAGYHGHVVGLNTPIAVTLTTTTHPTGPDVLRMLTDSEGLLRVGSRLPGVPVGGREPGKVNLNTANDVRVLNAVLDPQGGNGFTAAYATNLWGNYISPSMPPAMNIARTPNGIPRATINEGGTDYPFAWGSTTWGPVDYPADAVPPRDHPFGRRVVDDPTGTTTPNPLVFPNYNAQPSAAIANSWHPYLFNEPLQKAWNNLTPVSDSFLIVMTVGFFEVDNAGPWNVTNQPQLGRELFDKVPGDLRVQFAGVIDRSQLFTEIAQNDPSTGIAQGARLAVNLDPSNNPVPRGVQTKLVTDTTFGATSINIEAIPPGGVRPDGQTVQAGTCAILGDGVVYTVGAGSIIRVGYGDSLAPVTPCDGEWLIVSSAVPNPVAQRTWPDATGTPQPVPGQVTLTVSAATRPHSAGAPVGNVLFGNPGPQPGVRLTDLQRRGIVPYFTRLEP